MRAVFTGFGSVGRKIVARTPSNCAAHATAAPWLPGLAQTTSAFARCASARPVRSGANRTDSEYSAPRTLNDPVGSPVSILRYASREGEESDAARAIGVGPKWRASSDCASAMRRGSIIRLRDLQLARRLRVL